jgi:leucyl aminopeptidase
MPSFAVATDPLTALQAETLAVFAWKDDTAEPARAVPTADAAAAGDAFGLDLAAQLAGIRFEADLGAVARVPTRGGGTTALLLVVGLGQAADADLETLRRGAGAAARNAAKDSRLAVVVPSDVPGGDAQACAEAVLVGSALGAYAFTTYRTKTHDSPSLRELLLVPGDGVSPEAVEAGLAAGEPVARATALARDFVNTPPSAKRPPTLAQRFADVAQAAGLQARVFDEDALAEGGFGGILGVGQGSSERPRLVELTYAPSDANGHVVLVGKGITFDSGGLSLKPSQSMTTMKSDMSGAAAVVAAMSVLAEIGVSVKVTGLAALAENMPSGDAIRVSDVLTHRGGKTVEVMNTDAEGRLVLADALAYATELEPDAIIDLATLTGAQIVALGPKVSAVMGNDEDLVEAVREAARAAGEHVWPLPLHAEYAEQLRSEVADLKNIGKQGQAGTIIAGLFLKEFTGGVPWAHLDIAGPAFTEEGDAFYTPKGATGAGVRLLIRFLQSRSGSARG